MVTRVLLLHRNFDRQIGYRATHRLRYAGPLDPVLDPLAGKNDPLTIISWAGRKKRCTTY